MKKLVRTKPSQGQGNNAVIETSTQRLAVLGGKSDVLNWLTSQPRIFEYWIFQLARARRLIVFDEKTSEWKVAQNYMKKLCATKIFFRAIIILHNETSCATTLCNNTPVGNGGLLHCCTGVLCTEAPLTPYAKKIDAFVARMFCQITRPCSGTTSAPPQKSNRMPNIWHKS